MRVEVWLHGECARYGNKTNLDSVATLSIDLAAGSTVQDLLDYLLICTQELSALSINGQSVARPHRQLNITIALQDGDRIDLFDSQHSPISA